MLEITFISLLAICYFVPYLSAKGFYDIKDKVQTLNQLNKSLSESKQDNDSILNDLNYKLDQMSNEDTKL
ncbi:hypothetical protein UA38_11770 [Photobacterium kishitanii]|uniref:Uncharacterized protein n=1 Tax=Photobacterium kishitanii TaxID=318456 RepID=A0AAX0YWF7_9GAMM|nr:hypothetical protein [Photobacterium kishitanii]KJG57046.1 hypothetical protein UA38_11770 [Photobacterium kishitanii]KJG60571.1 hypothetical protein UA42_14560 [Photobacterium kishitanii]KJG64873.1 hypothetical protein UA40_14255 [Photobacterium kishitanii]KJG68509.1 hypothetical protein UA41_16665 [Photobacterium kishitanii]OBU31207.1 hypothetical protein AYY23_20050 [Photobacterium kishitanii]